MAVVPPQRGSSRGKAAATGPPADQYPKSLVGLFYTIVGDDQRTKNSIQILDRLAGILVILITVGFVVAYSIAVATKGFRIHSLTVPELIPGGVVIEGVLTYRVIKVVGWFKRRHRAAAMAGTRTTGSSLEQSHTPAQQPETPSQ